MMFSHPRVVSAREGVPWGLGDPHTGQGVGVLGTGTWDPHPRREPCHAATGRVLLVPGVGSAGGCPPLPSACAVFLQRGSRRVPAPPCGPPPLRSTSPAVRLPCSALTGALPGGPCPFWGGREKTLLSAGLLSSLDEA